MIWHVAFGEDYSGFGLPGKTGMQINGKSNRAKGSKKHRIGTGIGSMYLHYIAKILLGKELLVKKLQNLQKIFILFPPVDYRLRF